MLFAFALMFLAAAGFAHEYWRETKNSIAGFAAGVCLFAFAVLTLSGLVFLVLTHVGVKL